MTKTLHTGATSIVYLVEPTKALPLSETAPSNRYALKVVSKPKLAEVIHNQQLLNEKTILPLVASPFVVKLYTMVENSDSVMFLEEFLPGGSLQELIVQSHTIAEPMAKIYLAQIVSIIAYVHSRGVLYRDLKPSNLLFTSNGNLKLIDFGIAKKGNKGENMCGSDEYISPEMVEEEPHSYPADWWAVGIILYEMIVGTTPFADPNKKLAYRKIAEVAITVLNRELQ